MFFKKILSVGANKMFKPAVKSNKVTEKSLHQWLKAKKYLISLRQRLRAKKYFYGWNTKVVENCKPSGWKKEVVEKFLNKGFLKKYEN